MGLSIGGVSVSGIIVSSIQSGKGIAEQAVQGMINEVKNDPAKELRTIQRPSGLSSFLDIKI